jgi:hypothetical protein
VKKGEVIGYVARSDKLGGAPEQRLTKSRMFHYGGSTQCVVFRKGVNVHGFPKESPHNVPVRSKLSRVL